MNKLICLSHLSTDIIKEDNNDTLSAWIEKQAKEWQLEYLLAHAEDGVIWGKFNDNYKLITADEVFDGKIFRVDLPKLRICTLQQCRIFGDNGEILLWRTDEGWQSRIVQDNLEVDYLEEWQILWGTQKEKGHNQEDGERNGFTLLSDGSQGLKHAVPISVGEDYFSKNKQKLHRPVRLLVRHYIDYNDSGIARLFLSRLVKLKPVPEKKMTPKHIQKVPDNKKKAIAPYNFVELPDKVVEAELDANGELRDNDRYYTDRNTG
ncbi:type III-D CRISPR-associated protein Csx19 [Baaleninema simplex]|uniref:type III-D CRISPR-associated protein Csx19 n=1 Tax=Baaleninema simplex TaxID=2862350 RepID=UPI000347CB39|nr:CRISPR-associated protein Csx19 [Baaleninema simplex]